MEIVNKTMPIQLNFIPKNRFAKWFALDKVTVLIVVAGKLWYLKDVRIDVVKKYPVTSYVVIKKPWMYEVVEEELA